MTYHLLPGNGFDSDYSDLEPLDPPFNTMLSVQFRGDVGTTTHPQVSNSAMCKAYVDGDDGMWHFTGVVGMTSDQIRTWRLWDDEERDQAAVGALRDALAAQDGQRTYRLPDGALITDAGDYVEAWNQWALPLTSRTGWRLVQCNPGFVFEDANGGRVTMDADQVAELGVAFNVEHEAGRQAAPIGPIDRVWADICMIYRLASVGDTAMAAGYDARPFLDTLPSKAHEAWARLQKAFSKE